MVRKDTGNGGTHRQIHWSNGVFIF